MAGPETWPSDGMDVAPWLRHVSHALVHPAARFFLGFKWSGLEHVPERGPLLLAANHVSNLDGPLVAVAADQKRYVRGIGKASLYKIPILGWYLRNAGSQPLDRTKGDVAAMRWAVSLISGGGCLLVFPEGTRSKDGKRGKARAGLGFLAAATGAPVVPVHVLNTGHLPPKAPVEVRFGEPLRYQGDPGDRAAHLAFAELVLDRAFDL